MTVSTHARPQIPGLTVLDLAAFAIACSLVDDCEAAHAETGGNWPDGACVETAVALRDELAERLPEAGAEYIWGKFVHNAPYDPAKAGAYEVDGKAAFEHAWVELTTGVILDPTAGQFYKDRAPLFLVLPGDRDRWRWHEEERGDE